MASNSGDDLFGTELIAFGRDLVTRRLERLGCSVSRASNPRDGRLEVRPASGRRIEVFVSTQRVGGYTFWTKRRLQPSEMRFGALVLIGEGREAGLYLVPSIAWLQASPPLTDRDYVGRKSEPEYGIAIGQSALTDLQRYHWSDAVAEQRFC